jgi:hypothetical protein
MTYKNVGCPLGAEAVTYAHLLSSLSAPALPYRTGVRVLAAPRAISFSLLSLLLCGRAGVQTYFLICGSIAFSLKIS